MCPKSTCTSRKNIIFHWSVYGMSTPNVWNGAKACEYTIVLFSRFEVKHWGHIAVLKDILNTTLGPLLIPDPHATKVPSNTLEKHSIGSHVVDGVRNLVTSSNMAKLVGSPTFNSTFAYQKGAKNTSFVDLLLNKGVVDNHSLHRVFHSFLKVVLSGKNFHRHQSCHCWQY